MELVSALTVKDSMNERVLIFNWMDIKNPSAGGQEKYCFEIGKRLARDGMDVYWFTSKFPNSPPYEIFEKIHIIRSGNIYFVFLATIFNYFRYRKRSNIIISMNSIPFLLPFSKKRRIIILHHRISLRIMLEKASLFGYISFILQEHLNPLIFRNDYILTNSISSKLDFQNIGYKNIEIVKLGVELPTTVNFVKEKICVSPGPIKPWKHHELVIKAFSSMPANWQLLIFGSFESEDFKNKLFLMCENLGVKNRVHFLGRISDDKLKFIYEEASICILGTEKEGWGLVAMEAQSYGCPIIGFDVPGIRDSVVNGITGILVKFGDEVAMANALNRLSTDEQMLRKMSKNAILRSKNYSWEECYNDFRLKANKLLFFP